MPRRARPGPRAGLLLVGFLGAAAWRPRDNGCPLHSRGERRMKFVKGQSGNPAGRPRGARNKATIMLENMLHGDAEAIIGKAVELAKVGDPVALRICMDRLAPRRANTGDFEPPPLRSAPHTPAAHAPRLPPAPGPGLHPARAPPPPAPARHPPRT